MQTLYMTVVDRNGKIFLAAELLKLHSACVFMTSLCMVFSIFFIFSFSFQCCHGAVWGHDKEGKLD